MSAVDVPHAAVADGPVGAVVRGGFDAVALVDEGAVGADVDVGTVAGEDHVARMDGVLQHEDAGQIMRVQVEEHITVPLGVHMFRREVVVL